MTTLSITDAKALAMKARARGVLYLGDGQVGCVSYGMTRADCDAMRRVNEQIHEAITAGEIEIPDSLRGA